MHDAQDIRGRVFKNASASLYARIVDGNGDLIVPDDIAALSYTVFEIAPEMPDELTAVEGHDEVALDPEVVFYETLQTGGAWNLDEVGYNFRHDIDVTTHEAFPHAGVSYQVRYEMTPVAGQRVVFRFLLRCL